MNQYDVINQNISDGKDIVFAENHDAIVGTFDYMMAAIIDNPDQIQGVSLELSANLQHFIEEAAKGDITRDEFVSEYRILRAYDELETARSMLERGLIEQDQFTAFADAHEKKIAWILSGSTEGIEFDDIFTPRRFNEETYAVDMRDFGALYDLIMTAKEHDIPVKSTDLDRELGVYMQLNVLNADILIERDNDRTDFALMREQFDMDDPRSILVHRGIAHTRKYEGAEANGLNFLMEDAGRDVFVMGNLSSFGQLCDDVQLYNDHVYGTPLEEGTDATIINDQYFEESDVDLCDIDQMVGGPLLPKNTM